MEEQLIRWKPLESLYRKYYVESVVDNAERFEVILSDSHDESKIIRVTFQTGVNAFREVDESFYYRSIIAIDKKYGTDFYGDWTFFKAINSRYSEFLSESSRLVKSDEFIHFLFITVDSILDVVATYEPKVELIRR